MFSVYGELSTQVYDIDKPVGRSFGEIEFYGNHLKGLNGPILEPAVGSGRVLIPLLKMGYLVEGFDISPEMLDSCKKRLDEAGLDSHVWQASMAEFKFNKPYEAVILPTGSFLLLDERAESIEALTRFHECLKPGGSFIVDIFLQTEFDLGRVSTKTWETEDSHIITMESKMVNVDFLQQKTMTYLKYEKWNAGRLVATELQSFALRWYGIEEFRSLLEKIGFCDIKIFGDYSADQPLSSDTDVFTFIARKSLLERRLGPSHSSP